MKDLAVRARVLADVRTFFGSRGYVEVETPIAVPSPGLDVHLDAFELRDTTGREGGPRRFLSTSPEYQMKRLLADGQTRIFQVTRAFRAGEAGERHNPEFTILEFYRTGAGMEELIRETEQLVARVTGGACVVGGRRIDLRPPFRRLPFVEAFARFGDTSPEETLRLAAEDEDELFLRLVDRVEPALAALDHGVFVTEFPSTQASLARKKPDDPRVAERFELYVAGVELCNGFGELTDPVEQRARLVADQAERARLAKPVYPVDERFLEALERGLPPCGGNAIGLDRLIALCAGTTRLREVIAFVDDEL